MDYYSKTIIMHQIESSYSVKNKQLSGICRIENEDGVFTCFLTFINIDNSKNNDFFFSVIDNNKKLFIYPLNKEINSTNFLLSSNITLGDGFSIGLYTLENGIPFLIAFSRYNNGIDIPLFKKKLYDNYIENPVKIEIPISENIKKLYDDEAVATENYYENDKESSEQIEFVKSFENLTFEEDKEDNTKEIIEEEKEKIKDNEKTDEELFLESIDFNDNEEKKEYSESNPFYLTVKDEIEDIFKKFPLEPMLKTIIPNSKFVRINYAENKFYVVGLIFENKKEKYIVTEFPINIQKLRQKN